MKSQQPMRRSERLEARKQHARDRLRSRDQKIRVHHNNNCPGERYLVFSEEEEKSVIEKLPNNCASGGLEVPNEIANSIVCYWGELIFERSDLKHLIDSSENLLKAVDALDSISTQVIQTISEYDGGDDPFFRGAPTPTQETLIEELSKTNWVSERNEGFLWHTLQRVERLKNCAELAKMRGQAPRRGTHRDRCLENLVLRTRNAWVNYLGGEDCLRYKDGPLRHFVDTVLHIADPHVTRAMIDTALRKIDRIPPRNGERPQG